MLCQNVILTALVASISTLRVRAWPVEEQRAPPNEPQTPFDNSGTILEALTIQRDNTYAHIPNDRNTYGSVVQKIIQLESPDGSQPPRTYTHIVAAPGGPGHQGVSYASSDGRHYQKQPNLKHEHAKRGTVSFGSYTNQVGNTYYSKPNTQSNYGSLTFHKNDYISIKGNKQAAQNGDQIPTDQVNVQMGSTTVQRGNIYELDPNSENHLGSVTIQRGNRYEGNADQNTINNSKNNKSQAKSEKHAAPNGQTRLSNNLSMYLFFSVASKILFFSA